MIFTFMNKNIDVFRFSYDMEANIADNILQVIHPEYAPLGVLDLKGDLSTRLLQIWWRSRAIPKSRKGIRDVLDQLHMNSSVELLEACLGLSLSDQYWIRKKDSHIHWEDVNFFTNRFSDNLGNILTDDIEYSDQLDLFSPDSSCNGNLRKKWKIMDGRRCLIKSGNFINNQEPFNEVIATALYERILDKEEFVSYYLIEENGTLYSCCETMVNTDEELVPAVYIDASKKLRGSESLYEHYITVCTDLGIIDARLKVDKMIVCDYILANFDRHYRNFGAIRNVTTLKWERIAPIFDSGSSLWATSPTQLIGNPYKCKPFMSDAEQQLHLVNDLSWLNIEALSGFENAVYEILSKNPYLEEQRKSTIALQVKGRIEKVKEIKLL